MKPDIAETYFYRGKIYIYIKNFKFLYKYSVYIYLTKIVFYSYFYIIKRKFNDRERETRWSLLKLWNLLEKGP